MSEIASLSKILVPPARQAQKSTEMNQSCFSDLKKDQLQETSAGSTMNTSKSNERGPNRRESSKKKFSEVYTDAVERDPECLNEQQEITQSGEPLIQKPAQENISVPIQVISKMPDEVPESPVTVPEESSETGDVILNIQLQSPDGTGEMAQGVENSEITVSVQTVAQKNEITPALQSEVNKPSIQEASQSQQLTPDMQKPAIPASEASQISPDQSETPPKQPIALTGQGDQSEKLAISKDSPVPSVSAQAGQVLSQESSQKTTANETSGMAPARAPQDVPSHANFSEELGTQQKKGPGEFSSKEQKQQSNDNSKPQEGGKAGLIPPGFEVRNIVSAEHAAQVSSNSSGQAVQTPARTGINAVETVSVAKPIEQIANQIGSEWRGGEQSIRLTLNPAELGVVRITFTRIDNEVVGMLEVQKPETRSDIEQSLPQLISSMQESGVTVRKIELTQWNSGQDGFKGNQSDTLDLSQQREFSQQSSSNSSMPDRNKSNSETGDVVRQRNTAMTEQIDLKQTYSNSGLNLYI